MKISATVKLKPSVISVLVLLESQFLGHVCLNGYFNVKASWQFRGNKSLPFNGTFAVENSRHC